MCSGCSKLIPKHSRDLKTCISTTKHVQKKIPKNFKNRKFTLKVDFSAWGLLEALKICVYWFHCKDKTFFKSTFGDSTSWRLVKNNLILLFLGQIFDLRLSFEKNQFFVSPMARKFHFLSKLLSFSSQK